MEGKGGRISVRHHLPTLHDRIGSQPPLLPPPLHLSSPLRLHPSFSLSVHLVCLSKSSGWKTLTCVRLCYLNIYTHGNKRWKKRNFPNSSFIFMMFYLTWRLGVMLFLQRNNKMAHKTFYENPNNTSYLFFLFFPWLAVLCTFSLEISFYRMRIWSFLPTPPSHSHVFFSWLICL